MPSLQCSRVTDPLSAQSVATKLCLTCGLCCDGTLFKDVQVRMEEDRKRLAARGIALSNARGTPRLPQPCPALKGCSCRVYADRPARCRDFECLLFRSVQTGHTDLNAATRIVRTARGKADHVRGLLRELGDRDEGVALSLRFGRMRRRFERGKEEAPDAVALFGDLTLAVHDLNLLSAGAFYPGT